MSVGAVVVSYHPAAEILANVATLLEQVDEVVVVDNGSGSETRQLLEKLRGTPKVSIIYNPENMGIAAALNLGVRLIKSAGHEWVATFDQDSKVAPGMIKAMLQAYTACPEPAKVASLSPRYQNQATGQLTGSAAKSVQDDSLPYAEVLVVITSGNLLKLDIFDAVGYFDESLFIDYVDTEFCLRCAAHGYQILEVKDAILMHCIGFPAQHSILGTVRATANHSSLRRYYIARNGVYVHRKFALSQPAWVVQDIYRFLKVTVMWLLFERERGKKLAATFRGIIHGMSGKMGKFSGSN